MDPLDFDAVEFTSKSHLYGETIVREHFSSEASDIEAVLRDTPMPMRVAEPFTMRGGGKGNVPKRQKKTRRAGDRYMLYPADLPKLNKDLDEALRARGWDHQPYASDEIFAITNDRSKGDFVKNEVFVEVEFGNTASLFRDLFKFQLASREHKGKAAVLVVPYRGLSRFHDSGVTNFEKVERILEYMSLTIQMPTWIVGLKPNMTELQSRYQEMHEVATANGVSCLTWEEALGQDAEEDAE